MTTHIDRATQLADAQREPLRLAAREVALQEGWLDNWPSECKSVERGQYTMTVTPRPLRAVRVVDHDPPMRGIIATSLAGAMFFPSELAK